MLDALIVGAGPTGLMMASELLRHGLTCLIIDKAPSRSTESKAIVIQARTLEVFEAVGLVDAFLEKGLPIERVVQMHKNKPLAQVSFTSIDSSYPFALSLEQSRTEELLLNHLQKNGGSVTYGVECLSFSEEIDHITATLYHHKTKETEEVKALWLIGCDGPHSTIRKGASIGFKGKTFSSLFSLADLEVICDYPKNTGFAFLGGKDSVVLLPLPGKHRYRVILLLDRCSHLLEEVPLGHGEIPESLVPPLSLEEISSIIKREVDPNITVTNPSWMTHFRVNSRLAKAFSKGRIFLVGDAAHIHSPAGGQGMNTGLQDAYNLAWKLSLVTNYRVSPSLLETYHQERFSVGKHLLETTEALSQVALTKSHFLITLRNLLLPLISRFPRIQTKIATVLSEIHIRYPKSKWLRLSEPRAPNAKVTYQNEKTSLFALWKNSLYYKLLIIDLNGSASHLYDHKWQSTITPYIVSNQPGHIYDSEKEISSRYEKNHFYLIRPDGFTALKMPLHRYKKLFSYLRKVFPL